MLVGEVDFLSHPIIAFVRLANSQVLGDLTEIPIPTRFLFIMLGPKGNQERFHEIGRSIATLMSDEVCVCVCVCTCLPRGEYRDTQMYNAMYGMVLHTVSLSVSLGLNVYVERFVPYLSL